LTSWSSKIPGDRAISYDALFAGVQPKFFFNFRNGNTIAKDELGVDLPSLDDARQAALGSAREMVAEDGGRKRKDKFQHASGSRYRHRRGRERTFDDLRQGCASGAAEKVGPDFSKLAADRVLPLIPWLADHR
jgi:hypothetical protein